MQNWLLQIIRCPITGQPLQLAEPDVLHVCEPSSKRASFSVTKALPSQTISKPDWSTIPNRTSIALATIFPRYCRTKP